MTSEHVRDLRAYDDDSYQRVPERMRQFRERFPGASLGLAPGCDAFEIFEVGGMAFVATVRAAYRYPNDPNPGVGSAWVRVPANDIIINGAELQAAETAAYGRAIVAALAADVRRIAFERGDRCCSGLEASSAAAPRAAAPAAARA